MGLQWRDYLVSLRTKDSAATLTDLVRSAPKALLRKAAERTIDGLCDTVGRIIDPFPSAECAN